MRSYKEIADIVREQGDAILERRKIRAQRIKRISCAVSGLCAALIICAAVWNNSALQKAPDLGQSHIEPVTEASSVTTEKASEVTSALTSTVGTTAAKTTVQTTVAVTASSAVHTTANTVQTTVNTVQTTPISSAVTGSPVTTGSTVTTNSPTITSTVQVSAVSTTDTGAIEVMPVTTTRPHGNNTSTDEGISTQNTKETVIIVPVSTTVPEITVPTTQSITTTKALVMTETTSATDGSAITTSAQVISDPGTVIVEAPDEETIKKYFNEISFNGRTYSYSCTVSEPTPELTDYMPFESYKLRAAGESEDKIITATAVLYMPEEGEKDHVWLKFDKKSEYCLYTEAD